MQTKHRTIVRATIEHATGGPLTALFRTRHNPTRAVHVQRSSVICGRAHARCDREEILTMRECRITSVLLFLVWRVPVRQWERPDPTAIPGRRRRPGASDRARARGRQTPSCSLARPTSDRTSRLGSEHDQFRHMPRQPGAQDGHHPSGGNGDLQRPRGGPSNPDFLTSLAPTLRTSLSRI